jgi:hypothetical protein
MSQINKGVFYSFDNAVGASANTASAYPPIFNGASAFPKKGDFDETFLSLPTLAILAEKLGYKTQTISSE